MRTAVFIDSCAWDYLYEHKIDLASELPSDRYVLAVTAPVLWEVEDIPPTGKDGVDKTALIEWIKIQFEKHDVKTIRPFGFAVQNPDGTLAKRQPHTGFNQGGFQPPEESHYLASELKQFLNIDNKRTTGAVKNGADASLAAKADHAIVLTNERKGKSGPLNHAASQNRMIVYLGEVAMSGSTLGAYIERYLQQRASP